MFVCPAGEELTYRTRSLKDKAYLYAKEGCNTCSLQTNCTRADKRWVSRHFYEEALERAQHRTETQPELMRARKATVERPFGHLKQMMGIRRFQCWDQSGVEAEMGLGVLAYNLNRMTNELGVKQMLRLI